MNTKDGMETVSVSERESKGLNYLLSASEGEINEIYLRQFEIIAQDIRVVEDSLAFIDDSINADVREIVTAEPPKMKRAIKSGLALTKRIITQSRLRNCFFLNNNYYVYPEYLFLDAARKNELAYMMQDMTDLMGTIKGLLSLISSELQHIVKVTSGDEYSMDFMFIKQDLLSQTGNINQILYETNNYLFVLQNILWKEKERYELVKLSKEEDVVLHKRLMHDYHSLLEKRSSINLLLEKEFIFTKGIMIDMRKALAQLTLHKLEDDVSERTTKLREQKMAHTIVKNVTDYKDLEGQNPDTAIELPEDEVEEIALNTEVQSAESVEEETGEMKDDGDSKLMLWIFLAGAAVVGAVYFFFQ